VGAQCNGKPQHLKPEARKPGLFYFQFVRIDLFLYICSAQIKALYSMNSALKYGLLVGIVAVIFKAITNSYLLGHLSVEFYSTIIASLFLVAGIYIGVSQGLRKRLRAMRAGDSPITAYAVEQQEENGRDASIGANGSTVLFEPLSKRELQVLCLIAAGRSNEEVAAELFIALSTVKTHLINIYGKLEVKRRTQAIAKARQLNLLS
jgi:DNA-binding CsgD family transcriptional regulator